MLPDFRVRQRDYLLEIARGLAGELNLTKLLGRILEISIEMLAGQAGLILLRTAATGDWKLGAAKNTTAAFLKMVEPLLAGIPDKVDSAESEVPEINRLLNELTRSASSGFLSGVGLPLIARSRVVGVIFIFRSYPNLFSNNDRTLLSSFADQAAIAVQNAQLYQEVNQEKQRMDAMLDSAADGFLILGSNHNIEICNASFARLFGLPAAEIRGKSHDVIVRWARPPQGMTLEKAEAGGWPLTAHAQLYIEGDLLRPDPNPPLPVGIAYTPLLGKDNALINIITTVRDITHFRQAEELKSTFISVISHELKTPVALIKGYAGTLRREDADWDMEIVKESLEVIEEEADRLTVMIENLLDATRLQAGGMVLKKADICLPEMAGRLAERFRVQSPIHKISTDFPDDFPEILADEGRLEQVLSNLISNAIKYSTDGEIKISGLARDENVIVCVSDQGPGIAPGDMPHVFDRFYRAPDMAKKTKGAGLGLFLTKSIVEAHGGRIWLDPDPDSGARICFSLPRQPEG